jgi:rSAM/selenodomain-associated transferase 2
MISIIIPTFNEADFIANTLQKVASLKKECEMEILVSDGKSTDETIIIAKPYATVVQSEKGKAIQLNTGAKHAKGDILFFAHADMNVPPGALTAIKKHIYTDSFDGGGFSNVFSEHNEKIKTLGRILNFRLRNREQCDRCIFYGDNGIFVRKSVFDELGGFKEIPIMEDYDFSVRMKAKYKVGIIKEPKLILDARRHIKDGFIRTRMKWILIKKLYFLGVSPQRLANWYKDIR